jgi:hypothetical protein
VIAHSLKKHGVHMLSGVTYEKVDNSGLHITVDGQPQLLAVDHVVLCAGQIPLRDLKVYSQTLSKRSVSTCIRAHTSISVQCTTAKLDCTTLQQQLNA